MKFINTFIVQIWTILGDMSPYLLFGFVIAGLLSLFVSRRFVETHLGGKGIWPILKASAFGVPLPLCSCGVIPVALSLRKHKASKAATIAFLLSTPQTGVDSIMVTYSLLGGLLAIFRPIVALITGLVGGVSTELFTNKEVIEQEDCQESCCNNAKSEGVFKRIFKFSFVTLPADIAKPVLIGLAIAACLSAIIPDDFFAEYLGQGFGAMVIMMLLGIPVYVCATASVPIAVVLIGKGLTPGAAMVFLMTGPATNAITFSTILKTMGWRTAVVYIVTVIGCALTFGVLLDYMISIGFKVNIADGKSSMLGPMVSNISAVTLLLMLLWPIFKDVFSGKKREH